MAGFIKLYRDIRQWEWYKDIPVRILFEHCLLCANHEAKRWQGIVIERGSFVTSLKNLAFDTGLTIMQVRKAIDKLKITREITHEGHSKYSIITVNNWDLYQTNNTQDNNQITNKEQTNNTQRTTNKNEKNDKNEENIERAARARDKRYIEAPILENDPFLSKNVQTFLEAYKKEVKRPCRLSPDERIRLLSILNDLIMQGLKIEEISAGVCSNFLKMNARNNFGINWLLQGNNFYAILNGEWQKKDLPKDAADTGGNKSSLSEVEAYIRARKEKENLNNEYG